MLSAATAIVRWVAPVGLPESVQQPAAYAERNERKSVIVTILSPLKSASGSVGPTAKAARNARKSVTVMRPSLSRSPRQNTVNDACADRTDPHESVTWAS